MGARRTVLAGALALAFVAGMPVARADDTVSFVMNYREGQLVPPAQIEKDELAIAGECVLLGQDENSTHLERKDEVVFERGLPHPGAYYLWVHVNWHCTCGRDLLLETNGRFNEATEKAFGPRRCVVSSGASPRLWRWVTAGACTFSGDRMQIHVKGYSHYLRFDAIAASSSADYRPPGYVDERETLAIRSATVDKPAAGSDAETTLYAIGEHAWGNFSLSATFPILDRASVPSGAVCGIAFAQAQNGDGYKISIAAEEGKNAGIIVQAREGGQITQLAAAETDAADELHTLDVARINSRLAARFDGVPLLTADVVGRPSGSLFFYWEKMPPFVIRNIDVSALPVFEDQFNKELTWRSLNGNWRIIDQDGTGTSEHALQMANGAPYGIVSPPWPLPASCRFSCIQRILDGGTAGIAFNIADMEHFQAFVLTRTTTTEAKIVSKDGSVEREIALGKKEGDAGQWRTMAVGQDGKVFSFYLDGEQVGSLCQPARLGDIPRGLINWQGTQCLFTSVTAAPEIERANWIYFFDPISGKRSLSYWRQKSGRYQLDSVHHLWMSPAEGKGFELELRRTLPGGFMIESSLEPPAKPERGESVDDLLPDPVLPNDLRIGYQLQLVGNDTRTWRATVDAKQLRDLRVTCDGAEVLHTSQPTPPKEAVNLFASISGDEFRAGISGAVEGECRLPDLPAKPEWRVSIISEGGDGTGTLAIMTIEIKGDRLS